MIPSGAGGVGRGFFVGRRSPQPRYRLDTSAFWGYKALQASTGTSTVADNTPSERAGGGVKPGTERNPKILPELPTESEGSERAGSRAFSRIGRARPLQRRERPGERLRASRVVPRESPLGLPSLQG